MNVKKRQAESSSVVHISDKEFSKHRGMGLSSTFAVPLEGPRPLKKRLQKEKIRLSFRGKF